MNVRVVPFRLRHLSQPDGEIQGAPEIGKWELLLEVVLPHNLPAGVELPE
jgi:hypothetical protein